MHLQLSFRNHIRPYLNCESTTDAEASEPIAHVPTIWIHPCVCWTTIHFQYSSDRKVKAVHAGSGVAAYVIFRVFKAAVSSTTRRMNLIPDLNDIKIIEIVLNYSNYLYTFIPSTMSSISSGWVTRPKSIKANCVSSRTPALYSSPLSWIEPLLRGRPNTE